MMFLALGNYSTCRAMLQVDRVRFSSSLAVDWNDSAGENKLAVEVSRESITRLVLQVPDTVVDRNSPAWNGGEIHISRDEVGAAYLSQFRKDFSAFLAARAVEMVLGGCMLICLSGRNSVDIKEQGGIGHISHQMEAVFEELIREGVIEKEQVDLFNLPLFCPNVEELESIVNTEKSFEIVESVKLFSRLQLHPISEVRKGDEEMFGKMVMNNYRAAFENLVRSQLGSDVLTNELFSRIEKIATVKSQEYLSNRIDQILAFLVRK